MMRKYLVRFLEGRGAAMRSAYSALDKQNLFPIPLPP